MEHGFLGLVESRELAVQAVVDSPMSGVGGVGRVYLHQLAHLIKRDLTQCDAGQVGGTPKVGRDRIGDWLDGVVEYFGVDLAPQVRVGPSPEEAYGIDAPSGEFLRGLVQPSA